MSRNSHLRGGKRWILAIHPFFPAVGASWLLPKASSLAKQVGLRSCATTCSLVVMTNCRSTIWQNRGRHGDCQNAHQIMASCHRHGACLNAPGFPSCYIRGGARLSARALQYEPVANGSTQALASSGQVTQTGTDWRQTSPPPISFGNWLYRRGDATLGKCQRA
jgi:hypothetical protein